MTAITGYYDGNVCIPLAKTKMKPYQKVIITILNEFTQDVPVKKSKLHRKFGIIQDTDYYMSPDFDEPLDDFKEYM